MSAAKILTALASTSFKERPERALLELRDIIQERDILLAAVRAALDEEPGAIRVYCEDFGLIIDRLSNPPTRIDVLEHALAVIAKRRVANDPAPPVPVADIPPPTWTP